MAAAQGIVAGETQGPPEEGGQELEPLRVLKAEYGHAYDIGTVTIAGKDGPALLWVAIRLQGAAPEALAGSTPAALADALAADQAGSQ
jgi:hypothetical protein